MAAKKTTKKNNKTARSTTKSISKKEDQNEEEIDKLDKKLDKLLGKVDLGKEGIYKVKDKTINTIKDHPFATAAVSAGIGATTALLVHLLISKKKLISSDYEEEEEKNFLKKLINKENLSDLKDNASSWIEDNPKTSLAISSLVSSLAGAGISALANSLLPEKKPIKEKTLREKIIDLLE